MERQFKARCSKLGALMTDPRTKKDREAGLLSETAKGVVMEQFLYDRYGYRKWMDSKHMVKGREKEETAISMYADWIERKEGSYPFITKNKDRLECGYLTGEPDILVEEDLVADTKVAWDLHTFHNNEGLKTSTGRLTAYGWQLVGYCLLTNRNRADLVYALINNPEWQIEDAKRRAYFQTNPDLRDEPEFELIAKMVEKSMTFDNVEVAERVRVWSMELSDELLSKYEAAIIKRVDEANNYYKQLLEQWKGEQFYKRV